MIKKFPRSDIATSRENRSSWARRALAAGPGPGLLLQPLAAALAAGGAGRGVHLRVHPDLSAAPAPGAGALPELEAADVARLLPIAITSWTRLRLVSVSAHTHFESLHLLVRLPCRNSFRWPLSYYRTHILSIPHLTIPLF